MGEVVRLLQLTLEWQGETTEQCARVGSTRDTGGEVERERELRQIFILKKLVATHTFERVI